MILVLLNVDGYLSRYKKDFFESLKNLITDIHSQ